MWARHSHAWTINSPTWPVEWQQLSSFLGWQDYMATGQTDLAEAFTQKMYDRTMIGALDDLGLLKTDAGPMSKNCCCGTSHCHIVDWMPDAHETDETVDTTLPCQYVLASAPRAWSASAAAAACCGEDAA